MFRPNSALGSNYRSEPTRTVIWEREIALTVKNQKRGIEHSDKTYPGWNKTFPGRRALSDTSGINLAFRSRHDRPWSALLLFAMIFSGKPLPGLLRIFPQDGCPGAKTYAPLPRT